MWVSGYIISGGLSTRFGSNKMLHMVDNKPMAMHVFDNLNSAINSEPTFVGPRVAHAEFSGFQFLEGKREGNGPLGAICDVLEHATSDYVVFSPCDTPYFSTHSFQKIINMRHDADIVVAADDEHPHMRHWLLSCWNVEATKEMLARHFKAGERAIHQCVSSFRVADVGFDSSQVININSTEDLIRRPAHD